MAPLRALLLVAAAAVALAVVPPPPPASVPPHPRLILTTERQQELRDAIAANETDAQFFLSLLMRQAEHVKTLPCVPHGVPDATGILMAVRAALDIILTSAAAHLFRADPTDTSYLDRAVKELLNLCVTWPDWNTLNHALDTGEAELATGLAYDWLFADLNASTRAAIAGGIQSRGLDIVAANVYNHSAFFWLNNSINWNCVVSSGSITAALALYGDDDIVPRASSYFSSVLQPLVVSVEPCVAAYNRDSSWQEGPGYWSYASKYNVWLFAGLTDVLGTTAGLTSVPGVDLAARFPIYMTGAGVLSGTGATFDWADAHEGQEWTPFGQWWGLPQAFNDTAASYYSRLGTRTLGESSIGTPSWGGFVEALAFYEGAGTEADLVALPPSKLYDYINVAVFRESGWDAPAEQQNYLACKGGNSAWNHNHEDLGSFVFDVGGSRVAMDMGGDSYELPAYFGNLRWTYYRLNSHGHNVILFGNESQVPDVVAPVTMFNLTATGGVGAARGAGGAVVTVDGFAVIDLAAAYGPKVVSAYRRGFVSLSGTSAVLIVDEYTLASGAAPANLTWQLHTAATPAQASATSVTLTPAGTTGPPAPLLALLGAAAPAGYRGITFTNLTTVLPDPPFDSAAGQSRVDFVIDLPAKVGTVQVALGDPEVVAAFVSGGYSVRPIGEWGVSGPVVG
jgi:hypothetical protein